MQCVSITLRCYRITKLSYHSFTDIDECANSEANECTTDSIASSTCRNTPGSYECVCSFPWSEPVDNFNCRRKFHIIYLLATHAS